MNPAILQVPAEREGAQPVLRLAVLEPCDPRAETQRIRLHPHAHETGQDQVAGFVGGDEQAEAHDGDEDGHAPGSIADAGSQRRNYVDHRTPGDRMRRILIAMGSGLIVAACSSQKPAAKLDESGLARLNESQMEPVDEARVEEGRARDDLARARAKEADSRAQLEVARSERAVADAQLKRALAEQDLLKKQYANKEQMAEVEQEIAAAQDWIKVSDLKLQYLSQMIGLAEAERKVAEAHVATTQALTEQAKYRAMKAGNAPEAGSVNPGDIDQRVAQAQGGGEPPQGRGELPRDSTEIYNRWQQADARARTLARPTQVPVRRRPASRRHTRRRSPLRTQRK